MDYAAISAIFLAVGVGVGLFIAKTYLPSYLKAKGQNLATKEDVGEITEIVEKTRAAHSAELELLKSELHALREEQLKRNEERRKAVFDVFDAAIELSACLGRNSGQALIRGTLAIADYERELRATCASLFRATSRLPFFLSAAKRQERPLLQAAANLGKVALKIDSVVNDKLFRVVTLSSHYLPASEGQDRFRAIQASPQVEQALKDFKDELEIPGKEFSEAVGQFYDELAKFAESAWDVVGAVAPRQP